MKNLLLLREIYAGWLETIIVEYYCFSPDALYLTAFEMFDTNGSEEVSFEEFQRVMFSQMLANNFTQIIRHTNAVTEMDFDFDCNFIKRYFGTDKKHNISYLEFGQLLHDFHDAQGMQAFGK